MPSGEVRWYRATEIISEVNGSNLCRGAALWIDEQITPQLNALTRGRALRLLAGYHYATGPFGTLREVRRTTVS